MHQVPPSEQYEAEAICLENKINQINITIKWEIY